MPARELTAVLECYGNPLEPDIPARRVGNVTWCGVRLPRPLSCSPRKASTSRRVAAP